MIRPTIMIAVALPLELRAGPWRFSEAEPAPLKRSSSVVMGEAAANDHAKREPSHATARELPDA